MSHLIFALTVGLCAYNFFRAVTLDPGTCPKPTSDDELKSVTLSSFLWNEATEIKHRLSKILRPKADSTVRPSVFNAWLANPFGLNTVVYATNVLQGVISMLLFCLKDESIDQFFLSSHCPWVWNCGKFLNRPGRLTDLKNN
jgi:hypothetical protein